MLQHAWLTRSHVSENSHVSLFVLQSAQSHPSPVSHILLLLQFVPVSVIWQFIEHVLSEHSVNPSGHGGGTLSKVHVELHPEFAIPFNVPKSHCSP